MIRIPNLSLIPSLKSAVCPILTLWSLSTFFLSFDLVCADEFQIDVAIVSGIVDGRVIERNGVFYVSWSETVPRDGIAKILGPRKTKREKALTSAQASELNRIYSGKSNRFFAKDTDPLNPLEIDTKRRPIFTLGGYYEGPSGIKYPIKDSSDYFDVEGRIVIDNPFLATKNVHYHDRQTGLYYPIQAIFHKTESGTLYFCFLSDIERALLTNQDTPVYILETKRSGTFLRNVVSAGMPTDKIVRVPSNELRTVFKQDEIFPILQIPHHLHAQSSEVKLEMMGRMLADFAYDSIGLDPAESSDGSVMTVSEACAAVTKRISDFQAGR